ncbi:peptidase M24, structural domain-containing protein [Polychytrium aggregatum]|uniref:peptidase M24, structural domain-containing protein n=1 Tax=Polychytrium aggregatum TaxID=110093 RepID=UPI0022FE223B|nr:peptidase M24, structural domain-containing protein [Polychytrium aggregatum]KAI9205307.1 peptidase M24, structural domain-containing protein [Polychytrium aggregatum]
MSKTNLFQDWVQSLKRTPSKSSRSRDDLSLSYKPYEIDFSMHVELRKKLVDRMNNLPQEKRHANAAVLLDGGSELPKYCTDTTHCNFRQESFFQYLFGAREPDCSGAIDLSTGESILFVPRLSSEWELWCGKAPTLDYLKSHYQVDHVHYQDEKLEVLQKRGIVHLHVLYGLNTDSGLYTVTTAKFDGIEAFTVHKDILHPELVECRLIKTERELDLLRWINTISSEAHVQVMRTLKPGMMEFQAESQFLYYCYMIGGARFHAYTCICGSGHNASALHYGHAGAPNDKVLKDGDLILNDMGCELHCYASDITCTFPVNGKFTKDQIFIYEAVLKSHDAVIAAMKPGVEWKDLHILSLRVLGEELLKGGLLVGDIEDLMRHHVPAYFYPHGLGHLLGLDVHDVGGYTDGKTRTPTKSLCKLRCDRALEKNMVLTVEPGCYFIDAQLDDLLANPEASQFVSKDVLARFRGFGGVRIESDVIVVEDGAENMTKVPRTVADIEQCISA